MRHLVLLRGVPGAGKSTWVRSIGQEDYVISSDAIRLLIKSPQIGPNKRFISQAVNKQTWELLYSLLENRMKDGEFTIVDATHTNPKYLKKYLKLANRYRYQIYCVQFDVSLEQAISQNLMRPDYRQVPEDVIRRMITEMDSPLPKEIIKIHPNDYSDYFCPKIQDMNMYRNIHFIGDIQGCHTAYREYHKKVGVIKDTDFYIFTGDLCDRGIENAQMIQSALYLYKRPNVAFIWGNHEEWLWNWALGEGYLTKQFAENTMPELEAAGIDKGEVLSMLSTFKDMMYIRHYDALIFVSHGGVSNLKYNYHYIPSRQLIRGVGNYVDPIDEIFDSSFTEKDPPEIYQVHGHRNSDELPINRYPRSINLEGQVEFGGCLRVAQHTAAGFKFFNIKNKVFDSTLTKRKREKS